MINGNRLFFAACAAMIGLVTTAHAQLTLNVNQATGQVEIRNPSPTDTVNINGYDIRSPQSAGSSNDGLLNPVGWGKLQTTLGAGWLATNFASSELLLETNANNILTLGPGASQSLGAAFSTNPATIGAAQALAGFGNDYLDLAFQYTDADNGSAVTPGNVSYQNEVLNNLVLNVNLGTGVVHLVNESSVAVEIEAYIINSAAGSLNPSWNGLSDTVANWQKNIGTTNALGELSSLDTSSNPGQPLAPLTIQGGDSFNLGTAFNVGGDQDMTFSFLLTSDTAGNGFAGEVRYDQLVGDYNLDGVVNAADYTVWRDNLGSTQNLEADGDNSGTVDAPDYGVWKSNFGAGQAVASLSSGATVPEPASTALAVAVLAAAFVANQRGGKKQ